MLVITIIILFFSKLLLKLIGPRFVFVWRWQSLCWAVFFLAGVHRVLQRAGGGEHPGQLCGCLWALGWTDGLWIPSNDRQQDPTRVSNIDRQDRFSLKMPLIKKMKILNSLFADTSLRKGQSWRLQNPRCQPQSPTPSPGGQRGSNTRRTRSSLMSLSPSMYW